MKKLLLIYPHFPPSNLAGVHRARLFAHHLQSFGWEPVVLTVHEDFYEEMPDYNLTKLVAANLRIEKVSAMKRVGPIGDIGLRAFWQLYKKAKQLLVMESFDFIFIPIPSFYCALLGRLLHGSTNVPYGIDYIDPWVHSFPGSHRLFSRAWFATKLASILEPIAIKNASLVTGVAEGYYLPVLQRNKQLLSKVHGAMPYGGEENDHQILKSLFLKPYLFQNDVSKFQVVYAGALLPKAFGLLENIFKSIQQHPEVFAIVEFHFIGTGKSPNDKNGFNVKPLAEQYGLWQTTVFEYPARIPYFDVLIHLENADAIFILGSVEPHYTPSKTYQAILSKKPLLAVLHQDSTAVQILKDSGAGIVLTFNGEQDTALVLQQFANTFQTFREFSKRYDSSTIDMQLFEAYSAKAVTGKLALLLNEAVANG